MTTSAPVHDSTDGGVREAVATPSDPLWAPGPPEGCDIPPDAAAGIYVPSFVRRNKSKKDEVKHGPPQLPIEEQAGTYMDRSILETFSRDTLGPRHVQC